VVNAAMQVSNVVMSVINAVMSAANAMMSVVNAVMSAVNATMQVDNPVVSAFHAAATPSHFPVYFTVRKMRVLFSEMPVANLENHF
jgi:hypothetical protein